jgi:hypothetical protein
MSSKPLLSDGRQEYLEDRGPDVIEQLRSKIAQLEHRMDSLEGVLDATKRDTVVIVLGLLHQSLKHIASGKFDIMQVETSAQTPSKWEAIKKRLAPRLAEAIDILMLQGPMRRTQLASAMKMDYSNCAKNVIAVMIRQGLIVESGGQLSLKGI